MRITYYLDVISSWCFWVEPVWAELRLRYEGRVEFDWRIALIGPEGMPVSRAQEDWFYRRSGTLMRSPFMLHTGWFEAGLTEYLVPNLVAEGAKDMGICDDRVRLAVARAGLVDGRRVAQWSDALAAGAVAAGLDPGALAEHAKKPEVEARVRQSTADFLAFKMTQRPSFLLENDIGDRAMFSGIVAFEPLSTAVEAMMADAAAYASFHAHFGDPPNS